MNKAIRYQLYVGRHLPDAPYRGQCFGLSFVSVDPGEAKPPPTAIHILLSVEPGTSALIWPTPLTVDDLRSERLLELVALLDPPPADVADLYIIEANEDESVYFLKQEQSRAFYDWELTETDTLWPMSFLRLDAARVGTPRITLALHQPSTLWEYALTVHAPQRWTPHLLTWVFKRHVNLPPLELIDWGQVTEAVNSVH
jgi:hypothetical protein